MAEKARDIILWNGKVIKWVKRNGVRWVGCAEGMGNVWRGIIVAGLSVLAQSLIRSFCKEVWPCDIYEHNYKDLVYG